MYLSIYYLHDDGVMHLQYFPCLTSQNFFCFLTRAVPKCMTYGQESVWYDDSNGTLITSKSATWEKLQQVKVDIELSQMDLIQLTLSRAVICIIWLSQPILKNSVFLKYKIVTTSSF